MGVIFKLAIRNMRRRKARYILTTITLVIGVALFGGILIARDSFRVMFVKDIDNRMGTADILIRKTETDDGWFRPSAAEDIENLPHVDYVSYRIAGDYVYASSILHGNQLYNSTRTAVYGIDIEDRDEEELGGKPYIIDSAVDGKTIEKLLHNGIREYGRNTIIITESLQIKLGKNFKGGDDLWVLPIDYHELIGMDQKLISADTDLWPKYTVAAIIRDLGEARDFDPETPSTYESPSSGPCLFANIETAHDLVDGIVDHTGFYNLVAVGVDDVNNIEEVIDDIEDELGDDWVVADLKTDTIEDINDSVDMMMTILLMFAIVALILSIILILNIFNIIKEEQEYETGMLQAVGASKSETFKMFLIQGVVMGIIGAIIGTICSFFMSYLIFYMTVESLKNMPGGIGEMFAQTEFEIVLYPQTLAITVGVGICSCILAAIYPSWKASRKPLIECLNPLAHKAEREKKHHKRKILYIILAFSLIAYGSWLLFTVVGGYGPSREGNGNEGLTESTASIFAPTLILLGIIGLSGIFVGPITKGFIKIFGPYLKHTKLLTRKNVLRHRKRTVLTFSMIALTVSYLVSVSVLMGSFREGVHTTVNNVIGCDIRVFAQNTPRSFEDDLEDIDGVADVMGVSHRNVLLFHEDRNKWIGHGSLEKEWDKSVTVHILDPDKVEKHMTETVIFEPSDMTLKDMMDDVKDENTMIITEKEADYFDLEVDDVILVRFSLGIMFPSYDALQAYDTDAAIEISYDAEMKVIAIVEKFQGFATGQIIGQEEGAFNIFVSWQTYEKIARNNLPGGNTDIIFRQKPQSGYNDIDLYAPKWFNFSDVYPILESIKGIDYYTTRMDYSSPTFNLNTSYADLTDLYLVNLNSSVVGIRTNSTGNFVNDPYFGQSKLIEKSEAYTGSTMEELLFNNTENVCVVDETYIKNMRRYDSAFGIGSNITIFPQMSEPNPITIATGGNNPFAYPPAYTEVVLKNGTKSGVVAGFQTSDNNYINFTSDNNYLEFNISINLGIYFLISPYFINPINITIESFVNSTISKLDLEVYNYDSNSFDYLGSLNSKTEDNNTFYFNQDIQPLSYINIETGEIKFMITGKNSTFNNNYKLSVNKLDFQVVNSTYSIDPNTWPNYTVIGIIQDPVLYLTERLNWQAGYEVGYDIAETQNAVYINYEKARSQVYVDYKGSQNNGSYDKITHVFIHCKSVDDIANTASLLRNALGSNWTILDLKTGSPAVPIDSLAFRLNVFDWYIWVEEGENDEDVLDEITAYMEKHGYIILFAFTSSYITQIFESLVDLITLVMNGILVFAIIIAMIGLALHCLLTTMARRREIGMLRSIGLNKKGVIRTISGETLVVAFLGTIVGIISGLLIGFLMVSSIPDTGFLTVTLTIPWLIIGLLILTTVVTAIISSRYPSKWAANINIIDAVRTR
ncbi:MAG: ABC transporter permease [Promethearchaeota archaeon]